MSDVQKYIVTSLTAALEQERYVACNVLVEDAQYLAIYSRVHGPSNLQDCLDWVEKNCDGDGPVTMSA